MHRKTSSGRGDSSGTLAGDESGLALIYVTVALPVIIGMALLAIDYGRMTTLHSTLQHGADSLALSAAAELDQRPDAISRANRAIATIVRNNKSLFASSLVDINYEDANNDYVDDGGIIQVCYLSALPANDAEVITCPHGALSSLSSSQLTTLSTTARYIQVKVTPQSFHTIFPATFIGAASNDGSANAEAVAGYQAAFCRFTPLLMCNPFESATATSADIFNDFGLFDYVKSEQNRRKVIALKSQKNQWAPGNFGFLQPISGHGTGGLAYSIAATNPSGCIKVDNISMDTATGNRQVLAKAFNVRFDLYPPGQIGGNAATTYPPGINVRKGYMIEKRTGAGSPSACNDNNPTSEFSDVTPPGFDYAMGFPLDACHYAGNCTGAGGRLGGGDWGGDTASSPTVADYEQYWAFNHGHISGHTLPTEADLGVDVNNDGDKLDATSNANPPSRYAVYRYEIARGWHADAANNTHTDPQRDYDEVGTPQCNAGIATDNPDRRIIYGALVNCRANGLDGGKTTGIKALAFGKFFMTQPMQTDEASADDVSVGKDVILYTEFIDIVKPGDADAVARDIVQLYR